MSFKFTQDQIDKFICSKNPEVMSIVGRWGVGKTHCWNESLDRLKDKMGMINYSYVSLFGINSLESFKSAVLLNLLESKNIAHNQSRKSLPSKVKKFANVDFRAIFSMLKKFSFANSVLPGNIETIMFSSVTKALICIDDLERSGKGIDIKDLLGLVSMMKDQQDCKVVLLLNDSNDICVEYEKFREKVVDVELRFTLTSDEANKIAFKGNNDAYQIAKVYSEKLDIINIRILFKIKKFIDLCIPLFDGLENEVKNHAIHSIVLFSWCHFGSNDGAPSIQFVKRFSQGQNLGFENDPDWDSSKEKWMGLLRKYEFRYLDKFDEIIIQAIVSGYVCESELLCVASKLNTDRVNAKNVDLYFDSWKPYANSFSDNKDEVLSSITGAFLKYANLLAPRQLNNVVDLFKRLKEDDRASEIINKYIEIRRSESSVFDLTESMKYGDVYDDEIVEKFQNEFIDSKPELTVGQVLERISGKNSWCPEDEAVLVKTTVEEYIEFFKNEEGDHLSTYIDRCLEFGRYGNKNETYEEIYRRVKEALIRIGEESQLNMLRIQRFGIKKASDLSSGNP